MSNIILPNGQATREEKAGTFGHQRVVAKPVLAFDLDGTLRYSTAEDSPFIHEPEDIAFYPHVFEAVWDYRDEGWLPVIVTNQGGVAHGHLTPQDFDRQMNRMQAIAQERHPRGWPFLDVRAAFCHEKGDHPQFGVRSLHRKPQIGMLALVEDRARANNVVPKWGESVLVGDMESDEELAERAGITFWPADEWRSAVNERFQEPDE